tara:strand:+ start:874 stop:1089 length:216 start_codon:yes stop_codon:yes gene_type:complete
MPRTTKFTPEEIKENTRLKKKEYYEKNKQKMQEINLNNYYKKIDDEVKFERIIKILKTMDNPNLILEYFNK